MKKYDKLQDFLLNESTVFEKNEDTNPLYYIWAVIKSANGKTDEEIKKDPDLKKLFKKLDKFCEEYPKQIKQLKDRFTPSEFLMSFKDQPTDEQRKMLDYKLDDMLNCMTYSIKSFGEYSEILKDFKELRDSEEMKIVIAGI